MKIELTPQEIDLLNRYEKGELENPAGELREQLGALAEKALAYEMETESDDDPENMLLWYYDKYKEQQNEK